MEQVDGVMSENLVQETWNAKRFLLFLLIVALLSPHTLEISSQSIIDASYTRYSVITVLLTIFYEYGNTMVGPYSTFFIEPPTAKVLLNVLTLILNLSIIVSQFGFAKGTISRRRVMHVIGIAFFVHILLLMGVFSYQLDSWSNVLAIPLPIFPIISVLLVLRDRIPNL